ncbi:MAG TPA: diacylglycerol kinase family lipid kinase [Chloroflexota bacterium]|nr:diacylglycerol kinase family lipid kinase [Chloroflexota bacterium]HUM68583.1 diacylglycerol kinase family lipid kinase [Chloroflexota bacterium]
MRVKVILNPYANRWHAGEKLELVTGAFTAVNITPDIHVTQAPGEGTAVARQAASEFEAVVAAGGDGTINEVVNGLIQASGADPTLPFGVLPIGTANDLGDTIPLPRDLSQAVQIIANGHIRPIDAVRVSVHPGADGHDIEHYFVNNCAIGMEPLVTLENTKIKRLSGNARYFVALVRALIKLRAWEMDIRFDEATTFSGPAILLSVCNGPRTGGIFQMAPGAQFDDGYFDYIFAPDMPKHTVLALLPRLFKGTHIQHPRVQHGRARHITITCQPGTPIHADGELIADAAIRIEYELLPGKVRLLAP